MLFKVTHDLLVEKHFYREGMIISSPGFVHPTFDPMDEEAVKALKEIGIEKSLVANDTAKEDLPPVVETTPKKNGRSKRQPY